MECRRGVAEKNTSSFEWTIFTISSPFPWKRTRSSVCCRRQPKSSRSYVCCRSDENVFFRRNLRENYYHHKFQHNYTSQDFDIFLFFRAHAFEEAFSTKVPEIPKTFHQNQREKRRIQPGIDTKIMTKAAMFAI